MPRESADTKGRRYVTEGRLTLLHLDEDAIRARCRGDGAVYTCGFDHVDRWHCNCPAVTDRCAHLVALRLVTVRNAVRR